ncbi:MAG: permease [Eubacteriales bacterium]
MMYLYGLALIALIVSTLFSLKKTGQALKAAWKLFLNMLPLLTIIIIIVSIVLFFLPENVIAKYLGTNNLIIAVIIAVAIGSVSLLPGFIAFPLCGLLLNHGVSYTVLAAFSTSLMMVGIVTFPLEKKYFGTKLTILRNIVSLVIAVIVSICIGIIYGEVL